MMEREARIEDWDHAQRWMETLARLTQELRRLQAARAADILQIETSYARPCAELGDRVGEIEKALKKFSQAHKSEFKASPSGDGRSYEFAETTIGFRMTPPRVEIENEEEATRWLVKHHEGEYARIRYEANREALLEALKDGNERFRETLALHGVTLKQRDKFFCEVKGE